MPVVPTPRPELAVAAVSAWLLLKAFSSGCTAMTGVEAVSNGVPVFREPKVKNAQATLTIIIATLILLFAGIAYLCRVYNIAATPPGQPGYQSVLSQLTLAVTGRGVFYFITGANPQPHERVAVAGIGGLGHLAVQYAKAADYRSIAFSR